jgi:hypothetical protein
MIDGGCVAVAAEGKPAGLDGGAAQALADDIPILSKDAKLDTFGIRRI